MTNDKLNEWMAEHRYAALGWAALQPTRWERFKSWMVSVVLGVLHG